MTSDLAAVSAKHRWQLCCDLSDALMCWAAPVTVVGAALAFGAAYPVAQHLLALWIAALGVATLFRSLPSGRGPAVPMATIITVTLLLGYVALQLLPIPPACLRALSPATYGLYARIFSGWPSANHSWQSISLARPLTQSALAKLMTCSLFYVIVSGYPFAHLGRWREQIFVSTAVKVTLFGALAVSVLAVAQEFTWNGRYLWVLAPYGIDPQEPLPLRASGPFINPDHFACFVAMTCPLAAVALLHPHCLASRGQGRLAAIRVLAGAALLSSFTALLLSLSRGGWIGLSVGMATLWMGWRKLGSDLPKPLAHYSLPTKLTLLTGALGALLVVNLLLLPPGQRDQLDGRLQETATGVGLVDRVAVWRDSLSMAHEFAPVGVGLGAWPEVFHRFQSPPWDDHFFWGETHNDYLQLLCEVGGVGVLLTLLFVIIQARTLLRGWRCANSERRLLALAALAGIAAVAVHEAFDFSLQTPAVALLALLLLGLATRLLATPAFIVPAAPPWTATAAVAAWLIGTVILTLSSQWAPAPYPYNLYRAQSAADSSSREAREVRLRELVKLFPCSAGLHRGLFRNPAQPLERRLRQLELALWLDPSDPETRDLYAGELFELGYNQAALEQIALSVFSAPYAGDHWYLQGKRVATMPPQMRAAVDRGFLRAISWRRQSPMWRWNAIIGLANFYADTGRFTLQAQLYDWAARRTQDTPGREVSLLLAAGNAEADAGRLDEAVQEFNRAIAALPVDPRPYQALCWRVFSPRRDMAGARAAIARGIAQGADPIALYAALADTAESCGAAKTAEKTLLEALNLRPDDFPTMLRLGELYLANHDTDQAALWLAKATELKPDSAEAFYQLGLAQEQVYEFQAADEAYRQALSLDPNNREYKAHYRLFRQRMVSS
jgi:tetratricopeptide (TPR) repeat protein